MVGQILYLTVALYIMVGLAGAIMDAAYYGYAIVYDRYGVHTIRSIIQCNTAQYSIFSTVCASAISGSVYVSSLYAVYLTDLMCELP